MTKLIYGMDFCFNEKKKKITHSWQILQLGFSLCVFSTLHFIWTRIWQIFSEKQEKILFKY